MVIQSPVVYADLDTSGIQRTKGPYTELEDFLVAVNTAQAGDMIILANGIYRVPNRIDMRRYRDRDTEFEKRKGTAEHPIIVTAQDVGRVTLEGSAPYRFIDCEYLTWYGFIHAHEGSIRFAKTRNGRSRNNRFARCDVKLKGSRRSRQNWLSISDCKAMKVDHCYFHDKKNTGLFLSIGFSSNNNPEQGPIIEYNRFQNHNLFLYENLPNPNGDSGGEAVQVGSASKARRYFRVIFRYNYLDRCSGDAELIANKSCGNIYYNNAFVENDGSLSLRHGEATAVIGNFFKACGLRVMGADNVIANNLITRNSNVRNKQPLVIHNGNIERPNGPYPQRPKRNYERVVNNDIILNTIANDAGTAKRIVYWGSGGRNLIPNKNRFRGNIITGQNGKLLVFGEGVVPSGERISNDISDNIGWATRNASYGNLSERMAVRKDPKLNRDNDEVPRLQSDSPARNMLSGVPFESLTDVDIDGELRRGNTDTGCDQYSTVSTKPKKRITKEDVGPNAWTDLGDSPLWRPNA